MGEGKRKRGKELPSWVSPGREYQLESFLLPRVKTPQGIYCYHHQRRCMGVPTGVCGASVHPPRLVRVQGALWVNALRLALQALRRWGMFLPLISNLDPPPVMGQAVEESGFAGRTVPVSISDFSFKNCWGTFLQAGPCAWHRRPQRWARHTPEASWSRGDQTSDNYSKV